MKYAKAIVVFLISFSFKAQQIPITLKKPNKDTIVNVSIRFDENWNFLYLVCPGGANNNLYYYGSVFNPINDDEEYKIRVSKVKFIRFIFLRIQEIEDYLNGKKIFPLADCKYRHDWGIFDCFDNGYSLSNGVVKVIPQMQGSKIYLMSIKPDLKDEVAVEGHEKIFNESGGITEERYTRYFDDDKNCVIIERGPDNSDRSHVWNYRFFTRKNSEGEWQHVFTAQIARNYSFFYFYNQVKNEKLHYFVAPSYIYENIGIINNVVYEINTNLTKSSQTKYDFFKQFFEDYPDFTFRLMHKKVYDIKYDQKVQGVNNDVIQNTMKGENISFNMAIDLFIYEYIIRTYTNEKYDPFPSGNDYLQKLICEGD